MVTIQDYLRKLKKEGLDKRELIVVSDTIVKQVGEKALLNSIIVGVSSEELRLLLSRAAEIFNL